MAEPEDRTPDNGLGSLFGDSVPREGVTSDLGSDAAPPTKSARRGKALLLLLVIPLGAIAFAVYAGIHLFAFDHTFTERKCTVASVSAEQRSDRGHPMWTVESSCGTLLINSGNTLDLRQAQSLVSEIRPGTTYLMKLAGTGSSLELVSANPT